MAQFRDIELDDLDLTGERLLLRRWLPSDAERVHAVMQDTSMHEFLDRLPQPYTPADAQDFVERHGHEGRDDGTGLGSAMVERATGRVVGAAALRLAGDPEIGYWVAADARGHGYAAQAVAMLVDFAHEHGVHRVHLDCDITNLASARTALRAGLPFEGIVRGGALGRDGAPKDVARFARTADDPRAPVEHAFAQLPDGLVSDGVLALRTCRVDDAAGLFETEDEESVRWNFDGRAPTAARIARSAAHAGLMWLVGGAANMTMVDVATGRVAGELTLRKAGPPQVGGIGYSVHPAFRGRGYTARALRLVAAYAFEVAHYSRLELGAKTANLASQRAAVSGGFAPDGVRAARLRNADGTFDDEVRFALVNPRVRSAQTGG